jgi:hypothetical protein
MVRDEFLGAAGASGGGGGGGGNTYASAALYLNFYQFYTLSGIYRWTPSGVGAEYVLPTGYGSLGTPTNPNFALGTGELVSNKNQNSIILYAPITPPNCSFTFNPAVGVSTPCGNYYSNQPYTLANAAAFNTAGTAGAFFNSTNLRGYAFNASTGWGSQLGATVNPGSVSGSSIKGMYFMCDDTVLVVQTDTIPYIHAYAWSNTTGLGAKFPDLTIYPATSLALLVANADKTVLCAKWNEGLSGGVTYSRFRFFNVSPSTGVTFAFNQTIELPNVNYVNSVVFPKTGNCMVVNYLNNIGLSLPPNTGAVDCFSYSDITGFGGLIDRQTYITENTSGNTNAALGGSFSITSDGTYSVIQDRIISSGAYIHRLRFYPFSNTTGFGATTGYTDMPLTTGQSVQIQFT